MAIDYEMVGERIRQLRKRKRLSQADIATATDLSEAYISYIENATKKASAESLVKISEALGVTVDDLLVGNQVFDHHKYQSDIAYTLSRWYAALEDAKEYYKERGTFKAIPDNYRGKSGILLKQWMFDQKKERKVKIMSEEQKNELRKINWLFDSMCG